MFFKQFVNDGLGCASYLIGDGSAGECVVVDPAWDVEPYVEVAAKEGLRIRYVIETHNHADHVSGHGKLAASGAEVAIYKEAGVQYPHKALGDGDAIRIGTVRLTVLHTPGHRPEHISLSVTDTTRADEPWMVLTGDSLFVGDVGRPDLAVQPAEGAAQLFQSLHKKLLTLHDGVEIYPGHVAGSLCGKSMSAKGNSTIGFERLYNGPLTEVEEAAFVERVTGGLPPQPPNFERIVEKNRGQFAIDDVVARSMTADEVESARRSGNTVIDTRSPDAFGGGHIPGALNVHLQGGQFATRTSWLVEPERPFVLVLEEDGDLQRALHDLMSAGQTNLAGYLLGGMKLWDATGRPLELVPQWSVEELHKRLESSDRSFTLIDVRERPEWADAHIDGAINIPFHQLKAHIDTLPSNKPLATICGGGTRSSIAASILQAEGFEPANVMGGVEAWEGRGYPLQTE